MKYGIYYYHYYYEETCIHIYFYTKKKKNREGEEGRIEHDLIVLELVLVFVLVLVLDHEMERKLSLSSKRSTVNLHSTQDLFKVVGWFINGVCMHAFIRRYHHPFVSC